MPKQTRRRRGLTSIRRRDPMHLVQSQYRRIRGLNSIDLAYRNALQLQITECLASGHTITAAMMRVLRQFVASENQAVRARCPHQLRIFSAACRHVIMPLLNDRRHQDFLLCDVLGHLDIPYAYKNRAMRTLEEWSEDDCVKLTSFEKPDLLRILNFLVGG